MSLTCTHATASLALHTRRGIPLARTIRSTEPIVRIRFSDALIAIGWPLPQPRSSYTSPAAAHTHGLAPRFISSVRQHLRGLRLMHPRLRELIGAHRVTGGSASQPYTPTRTPASFLGPAPWGLWVYRLGTAARPGQNARAVQYYLHTAPGLQARDSTGKLTPRLLARETHGVCSPHRAGGSGKRMSCSPVDCRDPCGYADTHEKRPRRR